MKKMKKENLCRIMILILLLSSMSPLLQFVGIDLVDTASGAWWDSNWDYYRTITIESDFINNSLVNFPILVIIPDATGDKCDGGNSIRFLNLDNMTEYFYEIEKWVDNEDRIVWVNVTSISNVSDTVFLMYYGNAGAPDDQHPNDVWDANYVGVWHMNGSTYTSIDDSTSYGNDAVGGTGCTFQQTGQIGYAVDFERDSNAYINISDDASLEPTSMTVECWTNFETVGATKMLVSKHEDSGDKGGYLLSFEAANKYRWQSGTDAAWGTSVLGNTVFTDTGNWRYAATRAGNDVIYLDVNDTVDGSTAGIIIGSTVQQLWFGRDVNNPGNSMDGLIDEIRISNIARNKSWINATYHSSNNTTGFFTWGAEEIEIVLQVQTNDPIVVYTQNATLNGTLVSAIESSTVRFQLNNSSVSYLNGRNTTNQTFAATPQTFYNNTSLPLLNPGERYWYRAYANDTTTEVWGENKSFLTQPNASTNLVLTQTGPQITLTWTNNDGGDGCYIEFSENYDPGPGWVYGNNTSLGYQATPYIHTSLNLSSTYYYKAWAYANDSGWQSEVGNVSAPLNQTGITGNLKLFGINVSTNSTTGVEEMNATMWGWLDYSAEGFATCRFQYNNTTAFDINTTNQTINSGDEFSQDITGLTPGMLYHYRTYANDTTNNTTGDHMVFLTKPNASTNLVISLVGGGDNGFNLTWTNNTGCNQTVVVRNNTSFPTDPYDGWEIYNGTDEYFVDDPLTSLQTYYYRIWAYANWTWQGVNYHQFSDGNISDSRTYVETPILIFNPTNILSTTATLKMYFDGAGTTYKVGFWVSCCDPSPLLADGGGLNFTDGIDYTVPQIVTYSATGLEPGQYYYIRAWGLSANEFINTTNATYMIMIPDPPTNLQATTIGGNSVQLNWANFLPPACACGDSSDRTTVVRYSTTTYPTGATGENGTATGTWIYNGSVNNFLHTSLSVDTTYYYSMWTYVNDTDSSALHSWSTYTTVDADTEGGQYNITLRYENISYNELALNRGINHKFVVYYDNKTEYNYFDDAGALITTGPKANQSVFPIVPANGHFSIDTTKKPLWMEFHWNETGETDFRCNRYIIPQTGQRDITFYLTMNRMVFREAIFTINETIVKYAYTYVDETSKFSAESNALTEIFTYDSLGNKMIIDSEYWDTELKTYPWLVYGKKYFIGVYSDLEEIPILGIAPSEQNEEPQVIIPFEQAPHYDFFNVINLTFWWESDTILGLTYLDTDYSSTNVTINLYHFENTTYIQTDYFEDTSHFNHFWFGLNHTWAYKIEVIVTNDLLDGISSGLIPFFGETELSISASTVNSIMTLIFGQTPLHLVNMYGVDREVSWTSIIIFGIGFLILASFGKLNSFLGMIGVGGWIAFAAVWIDGIPFGREALLAVGIFMAALAIIAILGGVEKR